MPSEILQNITSVDHKLECTMHQQNSANKKSDNSSSGESSSAVSQISSRSKASSNNRDSIISGKHYDSLLGELRCPGCAKPMRPPILLCETGHSICEFCWKTLPCCPLCKKDFTKTRSVTLEAIASKAHFNCPNAVLGCAVRVPLELMKWHKDRCLFQKGVCFMGKVWGECEWMGCEINWMEHCIEKHSDKVFTTPTTTLEWKYESCNTIKPVNGYFIFNIFDETFNLYQIQDKPKAKMIWTLICASREPVINQKFAYEIEIYCPNDQTRLMIQRHACHAEKDQDILEEGRCISFPMGDLMRLMNKDKVLHYRARIIELDYPSCSALNTIVDSNECCHPVNYGLTQIVGNNQKNIPSEHIITRKVENDVDRRAEMQKKRRSFLSTSTLDKLNSIDRDVAQDYGFKKLVLKEYTIDKKTDELVENTSTLQRFNSVPKPPRLDSSSPSPTNEEIELERFLDKRSVSQPPSLPETPLPLQKVVCKEAYIEVKRASVH